MDIFNHFILNLLSQSTSHCLWTKNGWKSNIKIHFNVYNGEKGEKKKENKEHHLYHPERLASQRNKVPVVYSESSLFHKGSALSRMLLGLPIYFSKWKHVWVEKKKDRYWWALYSFINKVLRTQKPIGVDEKLSIMGHFIKDIHLNEGLGFKWEIRTYLISAFLIGCECFLLKVFHHKCLNVRWWAFLFDPLFTFLI